MNGDEEEEEPKCGVQSLLGRKPKFGFVGPDLPIDSNMSSSKTTRANWRDYRETRFRAGVLCRRVLWCVAWLSLYLMVRR